jgi:hypothetical protein
MRAFSQTQRIVTKNRKDLQFLRLARRLLARGSKDDPEESSQPGNIPNIAQLVESGVVACLFSFNKYE